MPVYLIVPRNEGFLGALRAMRAPDERTARALFREMESSRYGSHDFIPLDLGRLDGRVTTLERTLAVVVDGCLAGPEFSEGESGAGSATDSARSETCCGAAPTVEREGHT